MNLYSYANSNPSTFADPTGLFTGAEAAAAARVFIAQMETMIASGSGAAAAGPNPLILGTLMTGVIGQYLIDNYVEDYYSRAPDVLASGRTSAYLNEAGDAIGHYDSAMRFKKLADAQGSRRGSPCPPGPIQKTSLSEDMLNARANIELLIAGATTQHGITTVKVAIVAAEEGKQANLVSLLTLFRRTARQHGASRLFVESIIVNPDLRSAVNGMLDRGMITGGVNRFEVPLRGRR